MPSSSAEILFIMGAIVSAGAMLRRGKKEFGLGPSSFKRLENVSEGWIFFQPMVPCDHTHEQLLKGRLIGPWGPPSPYQIYESFSKIPGRQSSPVCLNSPRDEELPTRQPSALAALTVWKFLRSVASCSF